MRFEILIAHPKAIFFSIFRSGDYGKCHFEDLGTTSEFYQYEFSGCPQISWSNRSILALGESFSCFAGTGPAPNGDALPIFDEIPIDSTPQDGREQALAFTSGQPSEHAAIWLLAMSRGLGPGRNHGIRKP